MYHHPTLPNRIDCLGAAEEYPNFLYHVNIIQASESNQNYPTITGITWVMVGAEAEMKSQAWLRSNKATQSDHDGSNALSLRRECDGIRAQATASIINHMLCTPWARGRLILHWLTRIWCQCLQDDWMFLNEWSNRSSEKSMSLHHHQLHSKGSFMPGGGDTKGSRWLWQIN